MGSARSDKISFSELVPNLITPRISVGLLLPQGKRMRRHWRRTLQFWFGSWGRMSHSRASVGSEGGTTAGLARWSPMVHPTPGKRMSWGLTKGSGRRIRASGQTLKTRIQSCLCVVSEGLSFPSYNVGLHYDSPKALPSSKSQTIQKGHRNPSEDYAFPRAREKSKKSK